MILNTKQFLLPTCLLCIVLIFAACRSADTTPQTIHVGEHTFKIPKNYMTAWENSSDSKNGKINIQVLLPDFQPYNGKNEKEFAVSQKRYLIINIHEIQQDNIKPNNNYNSYDLTPWLTRKLEKSSEYQEPEKTSFGLIKYATKNPKKTHQDLYAYKEQGKTLFVIACGHIEKFPNPQCKSSRSILGTLSLHYRYPLHFLNQAVEIDQKIESLTTSFLKKEGEEP